MIKTLIFDLDSCLAAADEAGDTLSTIQILRPGGPASSDATHRIHSLHELPAICARRTHSEP